MSSNMVKFNDDKHCPAMMRRLHEFRLNEQFCDLTLVVDDGSFKCHKAVLISASDYFQGMFSSNMKESQSAKITLPFVKMDVMELILQFMYIGCATLHLPDVSKSEIVGLTQRKAFLVLDKVQRLLSAADMFQLATLKTKCEMFIIPEVEPNTCLQLYSFADMYSLNNLKGKCREVKMEKFEAVVSSEDFLQLDAKSLQEYISDTCIEVPDEDAVYIAVKRWYNYDPESRAQHMEQVLSHVRFPFCTPQFYLDVIEEDELMRSPVLMRYMREYKEYHLVAERRKDMLEAAGERVQPRLSQMQQSLVVLGGRESLLTGNLQGWYLDEKTKTWKHLCSLPFKGSMYGVCTLWNKLYLNGGNDTSNHTMTSLWEFSATNLTWSQKADMTQAREQHGATSCAGRVFVLGGICRSKRILKSVESYDPINNQWSVAPDLLDAVFGPAVASSSDRIYVVGGATFKLSELRYASNFSVQMFNSVQNQWSRLSNSIFRVTTGCATVLGSKVFVHCGYEKLSAVYKTETDSWVYCGASPSGHARGRALATSDGKVLLFGGKYRNESGEHHQSSRVDLYDMDKNQWTVMDYTLPKPLTDFGVAWLRINPQAANEPPPSYKKRQLSVIKVEEDVDIKPIVSAARISYQGTCSHIPLQAQAFAPEGMDYEEANAAIPGTSGNQLGRQPSTQQASATVTTTSSVAQKILSFTNALAASNKNLISAASNLTGSSVAFSYSDNISSVESFGGADRSFDDPEMSIRVSEVRPLRDVAGVHGEQFLDIDGGLDGSAFMPQSTETHPLQAPAHESDSEAVRGPQNEHGEGSLFGHTALNDSGELSAIIPPNEGSDIDNTPSENRGDNPPSTNDD